MDLKWDNTPLFLAPMAGITDLPFRMICKELGAEVLISEMVSTRGIYYNDRKTEKLLETDPAEHPVGLQLFGNRGEDFAFSIKKVEQLPFDFININMGCPTPKIVKNGDGCALMRDLDLSSRIISSAVRSTGKCVTVKIRKGWDSKEVNAVEFACMARQSGAKAIMVHARTREEFYSGKADWDIIKRVKQALDIPVVGNGDVYLPEDAAAMKEITQCDGIMIGRGALGNPWIFQQARYYLDTGMKLPAPSVYERLEVVLRHMDRAGEYHGERLGMLEMRKHLAWYIKGLPRCAKMKEALQRCSRFDEAARLLKEYFASLSNINEI